MQMAIEIDQFRTMVEALPGSKGKLQASQLLQEFVVMGLASVHGGKKEDDNEGKLTVNLISQCLAVKKGILSSERAVEILLEMENCYGTRSPFHQLSRLYIVSTKPSTNQMRDWVMESLWDWLSYDLLQLGDISYSSFAGTKHTCGLVALFEIKKKASEHNLYFLHDVYFNLNFLNLVLITCIKGVGLLLRRVASQEWHDRNRSAAAERQAGTSRRVQAKFRRR